LAIDGVVSASTGCERAAILIAVIDAPLEQDLEALSVYWWQNQLPHKIVESAGRQHVLVDAGGVDASLLRQRMEADYRAFCSGQLKLSLAPDGAPAGLPRASSQIPSRQPATFLLIALSVVGFLLVKFDQSTLLEWLTIQAVDDSALARELSLSSRISPAEYLSHGQYWRLITPVFLHFGWLHITFNMLWLWELGRRIEVQGGSLHFISVVFFIGAASNLYQAASTPYAFFGGMSGVVYGLLGYCAVFNFIFPQKNFHLPKEVYVVMLASLLVGWLGWFDFLARMANTAHLTGLLWGAFIAFPSALLLRYFNGDKAHE